MKSTDENLNPVAVNELPSNRWAPRFVWASVLFLVTLALLLVLWYFQQIPEICVVAAQSCTTDNRLPFVVPQTGLISALLGAAITLAFTTRPSFRNRPLMVLSVLDVAIALLSVAFWAL